MRVVIQLLVTGERGEAARAAWLDAGGDPAALKGQAPSSLVLRADEESDDGRRIADVASAVGVGPADPGAPVTRVAHFDAEDFDQAELFDVGVGDVDGIVDPKSVEPRRRCEACRLLQPRLPVESGLRLQGARGRKRASKIDLLFENKQWVVSRPLADRLVELPGVHTEPIDGSDSHVRLVPVCFLKEGDVVANWGEACAECGEARGNPDPAQLIGGLYRYRREVWDGSAVVARSRTAGGLCVSREVREILMEPPWRFPKHELFFRPIVLVDGDELSP